MQPKSEQDPAKSAGQSQDVLSYVDSMIAYYRGGAKKYGTQLWVLRTASLLFSIAVTVLSGIALITNRMPWLVTVVGGLATLFTGILTATKVQEYYLTAGSQHAKVYSEKLLFLGGGGPYAKEAASEGKLRLLAERVQEIYAGGAREWEHANRPASSGSSGKSLAEPRTKGS